MLKKPNGCVYPDCDNCPFKECEADERMIRLPESIKNMMSDMAPEERRKTYVKEYSKRYSKTSQYRRYQRNYKRVHKNVLRNREIQKAFRDRHKDDDDYKLRRREIQRRYRAKKKGIKENEMQT